MQILFDLLIVYFMLGLFFLNGTAWQIFLIWPIVWLSDQPEGDK